MALGVNIQWGYAGLFNVGIMGFAALGGVAAVLVSMPPVEGALTAGGWNLGLAALAIVVTLGAALLVRERAPGFLRGPLGLSTVVRSAIFVMRIFLDPRLRRDRGGEPRRPRATSAASASRSCSPGSSAGCSPPARPYLVGKITLGLRSDYLAIATIGISEIILAMLKNEDWLTRGVKNVTGLPRPLPDERVLQTAPWIADLADRFGTDTTTATAVVVRLGYAGMFLAVLVLVFWLSERALKSPWGRMMRAIRDNRDAAEAMGKDVTARHLQVFVLGSAVCGIAGAMLVTLDGQFTPSSYNPLRYTFLIWVMVIVGGSGNNWGAVLGGFLIWYVWIMAEPAGTLLMARITEDMDPASWWRGRLLDMAPHLRLFLMGLILLLALRFAPRGLIPEARGR